MRALVIVIVAVAAAAAACAPETPQQQTAEVARELCACAAPGDPTCAAMLVQKSGSATLPPDCIDCVFAHQNACAAMVNDCKQLCAAPMPMPGGMQ